MKIGGSLVSLALLFYEPELTVFGRKVTASPAYILQVSDFTHYNLYFADQTDSTDRCSQNDRYNWTQIEFISSIDRCPIKRYSPRFLTSSEISWKDRPDKNDDETTPPAQKEMSKVGNSSDENLGTEKKTRQIIHKYLAVALLLPKQPFSTDLLRSLIIAGPMFPSVTIVSGNGYDFKEMLWKYNLRSFPQLFFFKDGLLSGTYKGAHSAPEVALKLARWTKTLPRSFPKPLTSTPSYSYVQSKNNTSYFWAPETVLFVARALGFVVTARVPYCTEPIMGNMEHAVPFDSLLFIFAGCFVLCRAFYFLFADKRDTTI